MYVEIEKLEVDIWGIKIFYKIQITIPISTKKLVKNRVVNFENLIVEDIVIDT